MEATISPADSIRRFLEAREGDMVRVRDELGALGLPAAQIGGLMSWIRGEIEPNKSTVSRYRRILDEIDGRPRAGAGRPREGDSVNAHNPRDAWVMYARRRSAGRKARRWRPSAALS